MLRTLVTLVLLFSAARFGRAGELLSGSQSPVWYWQANGDQRMKLEVLLDNKRIVSTTFLIARRSRNEIPRKSYAKQIEFSFKPRRSMVWSGYREEDIVSAAKQRIKGDIWMAGADEGAIILGVSFDQADIVLMNTAH